MSNEHPKMLYRAGSEIKWDGGVFDCLVVEDEAAEQAAKADGWMGAEDAMQPPQIIEPAQAVETDDDAPPTRDELETKAKELGIKFDGRWGDKRLSDAIEQVLKD